MRAHNHLLPGLQVHLCELALSLYQSINNIFQKKFFFKRENGGGKRSRIGSHAKIIVIPEDAAEIRVCIFAVSIGFLVAGCSPAVSDSLSIGGETLTMYRCRIKTLPGIPCQMIKKAKDLSLSMVVSGIISHIMQFSQIRKLR